MCAYLSSKRFARYTYEYLRVTNSNLASSRTNTNGWILILRNDIDNHHASINLEAKLHELRTDAERSRIAPREQGLVRTSSV